MIQGSFSYVFNIMSSFSSEVNMVDERFMKLVGFMIFFFILLLHSWIESVLMVASHVQSQSSSLDSSDSNDTLIISESPSGKRQRLDKETKQVRADTQKQM